jgi:hypothetical protein
MQWGEKGAAPYGTQALARSHSRLPQTRTDFWPSGADRWDPRVYGTRRRSVQSPSHSLRSCSAPAGPLLASLKPVAAVWRFRSGDQRLILARRETEERTQFVSAGGAFSSGAERADGGPNGDAGGCFPAGPLIPEPIAKRRLLNVQIRSNRRHDAGNHRVSHPCRRARSFCVHRQAHGRDYAAALQWKLLSLTSERLGCSELE